MSAPRGLKNDSWGAIGASALLAPTSYFKFLWSHLSFIPGSTQDAIVIAVVGTIAGFLPEGFLRARFRSQQARMTIGITSAVAFCVFYLGYSSYVVWAIKNGYVEGAPIYVQHLMLFVSTFSWGVLWAMGGRYAWSRIFRP